MHRRPQTEHLTVKSALHTLTTYSRGPIFCPFRSTISGFKDKRHRKFYNSPLTTMLNGQKKNVNNSKFQISLY